jgi:hypothetical protein
MLRSMMEGPKNFAPKPAAAERGLLGLRPPAQLREIPPPSQPTPAPAFPILSSASYSDAKDSRDQAADLLVALGIGALGLVVVLTIAVMLG